MKEKNASRLMINKLFTLIFSEKTFPFHFKNPHDRFFKNSFAHFTRAFQIEMKFTAWKLGFKITEVPIIFTDRTEGTSKMSKGIFKEAIMGVLEMKWKSFFRKYERN